MKILDPGKFLHGKYSLHEFFRHGDPGNLRVFKHFPNQADIQANLSLALKTMGLIDRRTALWKAICELEPKSTMAFQAQRSLPTLHQQMF